MKSIFLASIFCATVMGCGGSTPSSSSPASAEQTAQGEEQSVSQEKQVESWVDWKSYTNVSPGAWVSKTHGKRFVEIYVNEVGLEAYKTPGAEMPVGSIVVKPSWENQDGEGGATGPLFVMEKMPAGFAPDSGDWFYAFQWENPPEKWAAKLGTNVDWRTPSPKVDYCSGCHDIYDRMLGMPPKDREWRSQL